MQPWRTITRMLSILAILGLVLAPSTAPAVAGEMGASMAATTQTDAMSARHDVTTTGEPCCMPARPSMPDCPKACPLAALCHVKIVERTQDDTVGRGRFSIAQVLVPANDAALETLDPAPPSRPPQA